MCYAEPSSSIIFVAHENHQTYSFLILSCTYRSIFLNLQLFPLEKIFFSRVGLVMFKCSNNMIPNVINKPYIKNNEINSHFTRKSNLLRIPNGTPNFTTISARVWSEIVTKITMDQHVSISKFKTMLKLYILVSSFTLTYMYLSAYNAYLIIMEPSCICLVIHLICYMQLLIFPFIVFYIYIYIFFLTYLIYLMISLIFHHTYSSIFSVWIITNLPASMQSTGNTR